jgi:hypothetical protein
LIPDDQAMGWRLAAERGFAGGGEIVFLRTYSCVIVLKSGQEFTVYRDGSATWQWIEIATGAKKAHMGRKAGY